VFSLTERKRRRRHSSLGKSRKGNSVFEGGESFLINSPEGLADAEGGRLGREDLCLWDTIREGKGNRTLESTRRS